MNPLNNPSDSPEHSSDVLEASQTDAQGEEAVPEVEEQQQSLERSFLSRESIVEDVCAVLSDSGKIAAAIGALTLLYKRLEVAQEWELLKISLWIPMSSAFIVAMMKRFQSYEEDDISFALPSFFSWVPEAVPVKKIAIETPFILAWLWGLNQMTNKLESISLYEWFPLLVVLMLVMILHCLVPLRLYEDEWNEK